MHQTIKKSMLKSPMMHALAKTIGLKLHKVENNNEVLEPGGR